MADNGYDPRKITGMTPVTHITGEEWIECVQEDSDGNKRNRRASILELVGPKGADGIDGKNAYELAVLRGFSGTLTEWLESINGQDGAKGDKGDKGDRGFSTYELAIANGFNGTEQEWLETLKGNTGKSAYDVAVSLGFTGTRAEWLETLIGPKGDIGLQGIKGDRGDVGKSAYEVAVDNGYTGTQVQWLASLRGTNGTNGISAYEVAVNNGFTDTEVEWLESLNGTNGVDGTNGNSAYEIAVVNGFTGTQVQWLESLVGPKGDTGADGRSFYDIAVDNGFVGTEQDLYNEVKGSLIRVQMESFSSLTYTASESVVVNKVYSDSSIEIVHNASSIPYGWYGVNKENSPFVGILTTDLTNMQVVDENTVIITGIESFETFDIYLYFSDLVEVTGTAGTDGKSAYEIAVDNGYTGTQVEWLESLVGEKGDPGTDGVDGQSVSFNGTVIDNIAVTGAGVSATETGGTLTIDVPEASGGISGTVELVSNHITITNGTSSADVVFTGYGSQTDVDLITASVSDNGTVQRMVVENIPTGFTLKTVSVSYEPGFNPTSSFEIAYPEPFGVTNALQMHIPSLAIFSYADPAVTQAYTNVYFSYDSVASLAYMGKSSINAGAGYRWRFNII